MNYKSIKSLVECLKDLLSHDRSQMIIYLDLLFRLQTESEQKDCVLRTKNNVGFTRNDAKRLTLIHHRIKSFTVTEEDYDTLKDLLPKYSPQIVKVLLSEHTIEKVKRGCYIW